jgi:hypothetical protein
MRIVEAKLALPSPRDAIEPSLNNRQILEHTQERQKRGLKIFRP